NIQNEIVKKLEPIEQEIQNLKSQKKEHLEIINGAFADEFDFDLDYIAKERDKKLYKASFIELANDELKFDISLKYKAIFEKSLLKSSNQWINLDKIVDVKGGKRLPKGENILEEDTGYKYIRVDDLSWCGLFDYDNVKHITYENHLAIKNYISNTDDILLTIVGATVGKCGLVTDEIDGHNITENFSRLIIKDKAKYFPQYVTYCLQSKICQLQIDEFTGKGSQGKLALFRVKKIRIPDIEFDKQQQIVEKIKSQIDAQKLIDEQIEQKQKEISNMIYHCVQGS
ncbi:MAG: restriction endonuclease subunit S, partial [Campylobacterales bacterium]|nr:restriction endonuclease subunit S [Campylobacterales bacterium]